MKIGKEVWIMGAIMALAIFARVWKLDAIPPGLWPDEALNGVQAIQEPPKLFYPENQGREGLMMWLDKLSFAALGVSMFSFRLVPAIIGILTVLGIYFLAVEFFKKKNIGLLAAFFCAASFWHINFSRINFRAIMLPLVLVWAFYFLFLGFRKKRSWPMLAAGIVFGAGFYTYTSFRLAVVILFSILLLQWRAAKKEDRQKTFFGQTAALLLATFFCALPIGLYFLTGHMADFFGRVGGISVFGQPNPLAAFGESLARHLAMFNIYGDPNMRHNFSGDPQLFWPAGLLFLVGFWQAIKRGLDNLKQKDFGAALPHLTLLVWFGVMILPGALTYEGMPHALRVIGLVPACYILAALGADLVWKKTRIVVKNKTAAAILAAIFLAFAGIAPLYRYFHDWAQNPQTAQAFSKDLVAMGKFLQTAPENYEKYVIMYGGDLPVKTVQLIALQNPANKNIEYLWANQIDSIDPVGPALVLFMENNQNDLNNLKNKFPNGALKSQTQNIWVYWINNNK